MEKTHYKQANTAQKIFTTISRRLHLFTRSTADQHNSTNKKEALNNKNKPRLDWYQATHGTD